MVMSEISIVAYCDKLIELYSYCDKLIELYYYCDKLIELYSYCDKLIELYSGGYVLSPHTAAHRQTMLSYKTEPSNTSSHPSNT